MDSAWLILVQPNSELVTRQVIVYSEAGGPGDIQIPSKWKNLVQEFHDIFEPPSMPVDRDTVHHIEFSPMLGLTTDVSMGCKQLSQQR